MAVHHDPVPWAVQRRIAACLWVALAILAGLLLRTWYLQVLSHGKYVALAQDNRVRNVAEKPERGVIFDRQGRVLAANRLSFDLALVLDDVEDVAATVDQLAELLDLDAKPMMAAARRARRTVPYLPVSVHEGLTLAQISTVEWAHIRGVMVLGEPKRIYPEGSTLSHVIGYVGEMTEAQVVERAYSGVLPGTRVGQYGAELRYDQDLRGVPGRRRIEVDAKGFDVRRVGREAPLRGDDIYLTIDLAVQKVAEKALGKHAGAVVVIRPADGQIVALASGPAFLPEEISSGVSARRWQQIHNDPSKPLINRAIQGVYPPGSVFKIAVAAALLETLGKNERWFCNGKYPFMGRDYRDWKRTGHGAVDLEMAIAESCDVYFYEYGHRLGIDTIAEYAGRFGFGAKSGIDLAGERVGILPSTAWKKRARSQVWFPGETLSAAIGQGYVSVTPMQIASFFSAIAANGRRFKPTVHLGVWDHGLDNLILDVPEPMDPVQLAPETFATLREGLVAVVNSRHGTGRAAALRKVTVAGKTGTAQVVSMAENDDDLPDLEDIPRHLRDHAWFAAYAPAEAPEIAVAVLVEHGGHGGSTAAPIARKVIAAYLKSEAEIADAGGLAAVLRAAREQRGDL